MSRVFITNKSGHDFSAAKQYGELTYITEGYIGWDKVNLAYRLISAALKDSSPDDYLILSSPNSINSVAAAMFGYLHGRLNILQWKRDGYYTPYTIHLEKLIEESDVSTVKPFSR